jgi:Xaa-Pro aminopeptidase
MTREIIKRRIKAVRRQLNKKKIDCLIVTKPANVTYTTGFSGDDSRAVITHGGVYLLTDSRYVEQAARECPACRIIQRVDSPAAAVGGLLKKLKSVETAAVEKSISLAGFGELRRQVRGRVKSVSNIIEQIRSIKDSGEIAAIKKAAQIAAEALEKALRGLRPAITENELAGMLDFQVRKLGARNSFETIVAFGANGSLPHHQPGARRLKRNDTVLVDFGVRYKNYCCDLTRCFVVGEASAFYKKVYEAVRAAQLAAIKVIRPGVEIRRVDAAAREVIAGTDLPVYGHGTGHGLGLEVHEGPVVSAQSKGKLQAGMVFTIEPAVYIPGKLGVRIEDDVLVTKKGCEVLSRMRYDKVKDVFNLRPIVGKGYEE